MTCLFKCKPWEGIKAGSHGPRPPAACLLGISTPSFSRYLHWWRPALSLLALKSCQLHPTGTGRDRRKDLLRGYCWFQPKAELGLIQACVNPASVSQLLGLQEHTTTLSNFRFLHLCFVMAATCFVWPTGFPKWQCSSALQKDRHQRRYRNPKEI